MAIKKGKEEPTQNEKVDILQVLQEKLVKGETVANLTKELNISEYELKDISFKANVDFCIADGDWQKATITKFYDYKDRIFGLIILNNGKKAGILYLEKLVSNGRMKVNNCKESLPEYIRNLQNKNKNPIYKIICHVPPALTSLVGINPTMIAKRAVKKAIPDTRIIPNLPPGIQYGLGTLGLEKRNLIAAANINRYIIMYN
jgi:hypothetical protein